MLGFNNIKVSMNKVQDVNARDISFDYLRVISTFAIVACHICYINSELFFLGTYLSTYVEVFFILSALLLGLKYFNTVLTWDNFLKKRISRLITSYYPYLFFLFIGIYFAQGEITSFRIILAHISFVNWFSRSFEYSYGHLWFLSMLMMCYVFILIISRINKNLENNIVLIIAIVILLEYLCNKLNINPRIITTLILFYLFFFKGTIFLTFSKKIKMIWYFPIYLFLNIMALYILYIYNGLMDYKLFASILSSIIAFSNVIFFIHIYKNAPKNKFIAFFSMISFEIYLVHHPLILGKYAIINCFSRYTEVNIIVTILIIFILSWILYYVSKKLNENVFIKLNRQFASQLK